MRIAITGGHGFIGSATGDYLRGIGHAVRKTDVGASRPLEKANVMDPRDCARICRGADVVIHCAAVHNAVSTRADPIGMIAINVGGTANMLTAAAAAGVRRFVFLSSAKIYGDSRGRASLETDLPQPKEQYALSKLAGEHYLEHFHRTYGMECVAIRPFSVYGPGQDLHTGYIGMVIEAMLDGTHIDLPGQPGYQRDFVHIDDVARLCGLAAVESLPGYTVLNAGSGQPASLEHIAERLAAVGSEDLSLAYRPGSPGTLVQTWADMEQAREVLGYRPAIELDAGLSETLHWFRERAASRRGIRA